MSDTGGTGGDGQHTVAFLLFRYRRCFDFIRELLGLRCIDKFKELFRSLRVLQFVGEVHIHQQLHHPCEHFHVDVSVRSGGDHEQQFGGQAVGRTVVYACRYGHRGECGGFNGRTLRVGDGDLHADGSGAERFAREDAFPVSGGVVEIAAGSVKSDQLLYRFRFVSGSGADPYALLFE